MKGKVNIINIMPKNWSDDQKADTRGANKKSQQVRYLLTGAEREELFDRGG